MRLLLWVLLLLVGFAVLARVRSKLAPRAFPPWMTPILETPWRDRERILQRAGLSAGERVLEVGPGAGFITQLAVRRVAPGGRIVCLDLQAAMLRKVRGRVGDAALLVQASGSRLPFREGAFDRAFLVHVLGEIPDQRGALAELARVIRPGGELAVEEGVNDPDYVRGPVLVRLAEAAGFRAGSRFGNVFHYTQRFARA
jgi:ubiquinone/menaquinone biosynthesis C-methylase UbiE